MRSSGRASTGKAMNSKPKRQDMVGLEPRHKGGDRTHVTLRRSSQRPRIKRLEATQRRFGLDQRRLPHYAGLSGSAVKSVDGCLEDRTTLCFGPNNSMVHGRDP